MCVSLALILLLRYSIISSSVYFFFHELRVRELFCTSHSFIEFFVHVENTYISYCTPVTT